MSNLKRPYIELHIAVLLYGLTAILGDLIQLPAVMLVWWRVFITSISLLFFLRFGRDLLKVKKSTAVPIILVGIIVAIHWICFYGSVKLANASVALVCMATTTVFTSFLEPIITKKKFDLLETFLGLLIIPGMILVVNSIDISMRDGVIVGMASAFFAALFGSLNKKYVDTTTPYIFTFLQMSSACVFIGLLMLFGGSYMDISHYYPPEMSDWVYVIILSLLCTTLAFILNLRALKVLSAYATSLVVNLEPLYGIILAAILLKEFEQLTPNFYIGGGIILAIVMSYSYLKKRFSPAL